MFFVFAVFYQFILHAVDDDAVLHGRLLLFWLRSEGFEPIYTVFSGFLKFFRIFKICNRSIQITFITFIPTLLLHFFYSIFVTSFVLHLVRSLIGCIKFLLMLLWVLLFKPSKNI